MKIGNGSGGGFTTKEEFLRRLNTDKSYYQLLKAASSTDERKRVKAQVEGFASMLFDAIAPAFAKMSEDPEMASKISEALKTGDGIIKESDGAPIVSGSKG